MPLPRRGVPYWLVPGQLTASLRDLSTGLKRDRSRDPPKINSAIEFPVQAGIHAAVGDDFENQFAVGVFSR